MHGGSNNFANFILRKNTFYLWKNSVLMDFETTKADLVDHFGYVLGDGVKKADAEMIHEIGFL